MSDENTEVVEESQQQQDEAQVEAKPDPQLQPPVNTEIPQRPENVPEKFWDAEKNEVKLKEFSDSYGNLEKAFHTKVEELTPAVRKQIESDMVKDRPETKEGYQVKLSEELQQVELSNDDPLVNWWKDTCYNSGFNNDIFNEGINQYLKSSTSSIPDYDNEMQKLGENSKSRISQRFKALNNNNDKKNYNLAKKVLNSELKDLESIV